jgi:hypothetical protein
MAQDDATRKALLDKNWNYSSNEDDLFDNMKLRDLSSNFVETGNKYITLDVA